MKQKLLTELTDQELLEMKKKAKSNNIINAAIIGFMFGVTVYAAVNHGFSFFTLLPLVLAAYAAVKWNKEKKALEDELKARNL
ncbi:hypothetical protein [Sphingobacterium psychroaquaticum]|uniref:Uncharacterized protein n=1 Tax=Sphingobacterium psychroaquaticum TaxID=561061 RepID=A0A1X7IL78_9SPHI|nr:hypothetical protein [Sphingobacterium psychroaquaticum]QBQ41405.1 hypothetical protein E2P86_09650 [Sphingobacterium psychroaquaticum]SMG15566.1 hypothetical protein SAMN05660862_0970 [Sphingobacterium psychroaquaticum]